MFTLENVYEKRAEFVAVCAGKIPNSAFKRLVSAETEAEFLQVIFDYFYQVYEHVDKFGLEYDYVGYFYEGFARVRKVGKWGFINTKFNEVCKLEYDDVCIFQEGFANVKKGDKWGIFYVDGREEF
jgi:hypothetical protein